MPEIRLLNNETFIFFFPDSIKGTRFVINTKQRDLLTRIATEKELYEQRLYKQGSLVDTLMKENSSLYKQLYLAEKEFKGTDKIDTLSTLVLSLKDKNIDDYNKKIKNGKTTSIILGTAIPVSFALGIALTAYIYSIANGR